MTQQPFHWMQLVPGTRAVATAGMFLLAWRLLEMVDNEPGLLKDAAFMTLATLVLGSGGLGAVMAFLFGAGHSVADRAAAPPPQPPPAPQPEAPHA